MKTLPALVTPRLHDIRTSRREREDVESGRGARPYQHEMNFSEGVGDGVEFCLFIFLHGCNISLVTPLIPREDNPGWRSASSRIVRGFSRERNKAYQRRNTSL